MSNLILKVENRLRKADPDFNPPDSLGLSYHLYVEKPVYTNLDEAIADVSELDIFACVGLVQASEEESFGQVKTFLGNVLKVANSVAGIMGKNLILLLSEALDEAVNPSSEEEYQGSLSADELALLNKLFHPLFNRKMESHELDLFRKYAGEWLDRHPDWWEKWQDFA